MNGKEMIHAAIEAIHTYGQASVLTHENKIVVLTDWRCCAGASISFSTLTVDACGAVRVGSVKVDEDKMYEMFKSVA